MPAALKQLLDIVQLLIDMLMVGTLGIAALAAVGLSMQFMMLIQTLMGIYVVGGSAVISRYIGSGRSKRAGSVAYVTAIMAFVLSFVIMTIGYYGSESFFRLMGSDAEVIKLGSIYFGTLSLGMLLIFMDTLAFTVLSAAGDTKSSLYIKIFSATLHAGLNYLFIFGHGGFEPMGIVGAAYATLCAYGFSLFLYGWLFYRTKKIRVVAIFHWSDVKRIVTIGFPAVAERFIGISAFLIFVWLIASYGTQALAGYQVGARIEAFAFMPGYGFSVAAMVLSGQYLGAKQKENAYAAGLLSMKIAAIFMGSVGVVLVIFPHYLAHFFTKDTETIESATLYLRLVGATQIPLAVTFVLSGALRGAGATRMTLRISTTSMWCFRILPAWLVVHYGMSIIGVYLAMAIETFIKGVWFYRVYRQRKWLDEKI
ncbi:MAG: MATE family efflux transporter [Sulfuricurvum sp. 17-40-25]|nr:MAG: MATE family efflux transporter [Campylobacterales bacterium 16-40-21]OZA04417.1 MAG: MATE family efflux transporter [Sulfuricurvum sp. 17-40-25]